MYTIIDTIADKLVDEKEKNPNRITGLSLEINYDYQRLKKHFLSSSFKKEPLSAVKYRKLYPLIENSQLITLQEGGTPLYKSGKISKEIGIDHLYFKYEGLNPTGAFKDRGSLVEITKAKQYRAKAVVVASTGNMAASVSAYCAKADIPCYVFIPQDIPSAKLAQILFYKARIIKIKGNYNQAEILAKQVAKKFNFYLAGDYAFRAEGQKSQAYEIIEQLDYQTPDFVLVPAGNGTNIAAIWKGFVEYQKMGLIDKLPKMVAVQTNSCQSIVTAYKQNLSKMEFLKTLGQPEKTIASAIAVEKSLDGNKVLDLLRKSKGIAITVNDQETIKAQIQLAADESLFVEPSSATVLAALKKLTLKRKIKKSDAGVCVLTGHGLKDPLLTRQYLPQKQVTIEPTLTAATKFLEKRKNW